MLIAGDIGGTKTRIALLDPNVSMTAALIEKKYVSRDFDSLESILEAFLSEVHTPIEAAAFGVAGPLMDGRCEATNLAWVIEVANVRKVLKGIPVRMLNDLETTAYGIRMLPEEDFLHINEGIPVPHEPIAIIAAGTGLGEAALVWSGLRYKSMPSEGGHCDFAPRNALEMGLLCYLQERFHSQHISYEKVVSGPGKVLIYEYLKDAGVAKEPDWLRDALQQGDPSPLITEFALEGKSELCIKALELFVSIYGAEAGNLALKFLARGGVYLGGGIAPTIVPLLKSEIFLNAFCDKGRFEKVLRTFPLKVILNDRASLHGAAHIAQVLVSEI